MTDALQPCPFCGGPVYLEEANPTRDGMFGERRWWGVICRNTENVGGSCAIQQRPSASKEAAISRWNTRAALAAPAVPAGWQMVPVEATEAMCKAAVVYANGNAVYKNVAAEALKIEEAIYGEAYAAMLAAAPGAPDAQKGEP